MNRTQFNIVLSLALLLLIFVLYKADRNALYWKRTAIQYQSNYEAATTQGRNVSEQVVSEKELKRIRKHLIDSLSLKRVQGITTVKIQKETKYIECWRTDTDTVILRPVQVVTWADSCLSGEVINKGDTVEIRTALNLIAHVIYYKGKRTAPFWKFWDWHRTPMVTVNSNCGQLRVESIRVGK